jgi:peptidoglycan/LPS O-acetylase OafA/YrhL
VDRRAISQSRLLFLDGLRGFAALFVVFHHAYFNFFFGPVGGDRFPNLLPHGVKAVADILTFGHQAVVVFIVLSGYCLMRPVVRNLGVLHGGLSGFARRRARRILPPYYAALVVTLLMLALVPIPEASRYGPPPPVFTRGVLLSHLLLVQSLSPDWFGKIDAPTWTVATEWLIYWVFATLLLPVWRKLGILATVALAVILGILPRIFHIPIASAAPWFLGCFAFGMFGSCVESYSAHSGKSALSFTTWRWISAALWSALIGIVVLRPGLMHSIAGDFFVGIATMSLIISCALACEAGKQTATKKLLESRTGATLGAFSFSLYLLHWPVLTLCDVALRALHVRPMPFFLSMMTFGVALAVAVAYLFYLVFERPFTRQFARRPAPLVQELAAPAR